MIYLEIKKDKKMKKTIILSLAVATLLLSGCATTYDNDRIRPVDAGYCGRELES